MRNLTNFTAVDKALHEHISGRVREDSGYALAYAYLQAAEELHGIGEAIWAVVSELQQRRVSDGADIIASS